MLMWIDASELALGVALLMDSDGCCCWHGLWYFAVDAGVVIWTLLSMLDFSLSMSDVIPLGQFGAALVYTCLWGLRCSSPTYDFDYRRRLGKRRMVLGLTFVVVFSLVSVVFLDRYFSQLDFSFLL